MAPDLRQRISRPRLDYAAAAMFVLVPVVVALVVPPSAGRVGIMLVLVIAVTLSARLWGPGPGVFAALLSYVGLIALTASGTTDLHADDLGRWAEGVTYVATTLFLATQVGQLRREQEGARAGEAAAVTISHLSAALVPDASDREVADDVVAAVRQLSGASWVGLLGPDGHDLPTAFAQSAADGASSDLETRLVIAYAWEHGVSVGLGSGNGEGASVTSAVQGSVPHATAIGSSTKRTDIAIALVSSEGRVGGVLYVGPAAKGRRYSPLVVDQLVLIGRQLAIFGERQRLKDDVADARATQEAEQLRASLMASLSHELKTPIASMGATIGGLLDEHDPTPERVRAELGSVGTDLARLDRSISELLDLSRLETDEWRSAKDWHDLGDVVGSVVGAMPERDQVRIVLDLPDEPVLACVDFVQVSRAVHHVVENALAYSDRDERVVVSVSSSGEHALVTVTDRGPGVSVAERTRIFEKFYRGEASARVPHGTGLGLAISAEIVTRHGGIVRVEPVRPQGARFVLEFAHGGPSDPAYALQEQEIE